MDADEYDADFDDNAYLQEDWDEYEGVDPAIAQAIIKGKEKEMNAMEEFEIFETVENIPDSADI
eukprot:4019119-Pyramimonas_sp.AAC.1